MEPFTSRKYAQAGEMDGTLPPSASSSPLQSPVDASEETLTALLTSWLSLSGPRERRRFLETHLELLDPRTDTALNERLVQEADDPKQVFQLREAVNVLHDAQARGGTVEAIREAYINAHGGLSLDVPEWLEEVERQLIEWRTGGQPDQKTATARVGVVQGAIGRAQAMPGITPETLAALQYELARALQHIRGVERAHTLEAALDVCALALQVYTSVRYPRQYAGMQDILGPIYRERLVGERRENVERAIGCLQEALRVRTLETFPSEYAQTQHNLGVAFWRRIAGERRENMERAIGCLQEALRVRTLETFPSEYAQTQRFLGIAYLDRIAGERRENLEQGITHLHEALHTWILETFPSEYAQTRNSLGIAYLDRIAGERRENLEQAIACFQEALRVHTLEAFPMDYALVQNNLAVIYNDRIAGERRDNIERAIACAHEALRVRKLETFPYDYAQTQNNLGIAYNHRIAGERRENIERAIACFQDTLRVHTLEAFPYDYALTQGNLGDVYLSRIAGERHDNLERAIACFQESLRVRTYEAFPYYYAQTQANLGIAYTVRIAGERRDNLEQAIACFQEMVRVWTLEAFPHEHRSGLSHWAETEVQRENWVGVHDAYTAALEAEDLLVALGAGAVGRDAILREGRDAAIRAGFALTRLGRVEEAAVAIERGRANGLAEAMVLDAADPERIGDTERRVRYTAARQAFIAAQAGLHAPLPPDLDEDAQRRLDLERTSAYRQAKRAFDAIIAEVRVAGDPADFLNAPLDAATILQAAERGGPGHALVYLAATPWGGVAVAALSAQPAVGVPARFDFLNLPALTEREIDDLPTLTEMMLNDLLEIRLDESTEYVIAGFACAQAGTAFELLQLWPGTTVREQAMALHTACQTQQTRTLDDAVQALLSIPALGPLVDQPVGALSEVEKMLLAGTLNHAMLRRELARCLPILADALRPVLSWLEEQGISSLTLIPCGPLAAFPLAAVPLADGRTIAEALPTSIAPNARSLLYEGSMTKPRAGIYAVGDPRPSHQPLTWSEAEALTIALLSAQYDHPTGAKVQWEATREWLIEALQRGKVVDASCHGTFNANDVLRSALLLANGGRLTLGDMLSYFADLRGLRLLILSACQTAMLDLRGARDEVRSLATGMVQAGAQAVLAAQWAVDDQATYLLVVRFAQEWLPQMDREPPAAALARAQHWLRTVTNSELEVWEINTFSTTQAARQRTMEAGEDIVLSVHKRGVVAVRGRGSRYDVEAAQEWLQEDASTRDPKACPYADPYYWAGFQITGW